MATQPSPTPPGQPTPMPQEIPPMAPDVDVPDTTTMPSPGGPVDPQ